MEQGLLIGLIAAISSAVVLIIERGVAAWNNSRKEKHEETLAVNEQAMKVYGELVKSLQDQIREVRSNTDKLETEYTSCREKGAEQRVEMKQLEAKLQFYEQRAAACKCGAFIGPPAPIHA